MITYDYSNKTLFQIDTTAEKLTYGAWQIFVILCSLLGDTTILLASIKYKAFNLHKIIVAFIQHIAVCDLLSALYLLSELGHGVLFSAHTGLCYLNFCLGYYTSTAALYLMSLMTVSKLILLKYPLKTGSWSSRQAHKVCFTVWVASTYVPSIHLLVDKNDVIFDYRVYCCTYIYSADVWTIFLPLNVLLLLLIPNLVIITSTILLLKEAKKVASRGTHGGLRWRGIMTVVLTAAAYSLSVLPFAVYCVGEPWVDKDPLKPGPFYLQYYRTASALLNINVLANFFVYSITVTSFRKWLKTRIQETLCRHSLKVQGICFNNYQREIT